MKKKVCAVLLGTALTCHVPLVYGAVQDYQAVTEADKEDNKIFQAFQQRMEAAIQLMLQLYRIPCMLQPKMPESIQNQANPAKKWGTLHWVIHWREVQSVIMDGAKYPVK